jgi:ATP-dependent Clp protease ATP-binding subunit ClpB
VQDPLAQMLLAGELADGAAIKIGAAQGQLTINGKAIGAPAEGEAPKGAKAATVVNFPKGA